MEPDSCLSSGLPLDPTLFWSEKIPSIHRTTPSIQKRFLHKELGGIDGDVPEDYRMIIGVMTC